MESILIVDDDKAIVESLEFALKSKYSLFKAYNYNDALEVYKANSIDLVLLDLKLGKESGSDLFKDIRKINPHAIVIIITGYGTINSTIEAIKDGVFYYLTKPIDLAELEILIMKGLEMNSLYKQLNFFNNEARKKYENYGIVSKSYKMKSVLNVVEKVKDIDSNVLITGESGTGKGLIAKLIHDLGMRKDEAFNIINCAAIPSELLESELFGYKKGAFTGASKDKKGYFELSDKGTLFLDEIGDMDINLQGKILSAIQESRIMPVGGEEYIDVDVRIITATNKNLIELIDKGLFREDLFYRINVINIYMPPLRERKEDIPLLVDYFINKYSRILDKEIDEIEYGFIEELMDYEYKGNIRELENIIERSIALSSASVLKRSDLRTNEEGYSNTIDSRKLIPIFIGESLEDIEKKVIESTYKYCGYNQRKTADILDITDRTIRNKLKKYSEEKEVGK